MKKILTILACTALMLACTNEEDELAPATSGTVDVYTDLSFLNTNSNAIPVMFGDSVNRITMDGYDVTFYPKSLKTRPYYDANGDVYSMIVGGTKEKVLNKKKIILKSGISSHPYGIYVANVWKVTCDVGIPGGLSGVKVGEPVYCGFLEGLGPNIGMNVEHEQRIYDAVDHYYCYVIDLISDLNGTSYNHEMIPVEPDSIHLVYSYIF